MTTSLDISTRYRTQVFNISTTTVHSYNSTSKNIPNPVTERQDLNAYFVYHVIFSDRAHFYREGFVSQTATFRAQIVTV